MSKASETFNQSILDAEHLMKHFTAWETYVEDRVVEATDERPRPVGDESIARLVRSKLKDEISRLHNPPFPEGPGQATELALTRPAS